MSSGESSSLTMIEVGAASRSELRPAAPTLLMTIEASVARATVAGADFALDRSSFLVVPAASGLTLTAGRTGSRVAAVALHEPLLRQTDRLYRGLGFDRARFDRWLSRAEQLPRTVWIHEIVHRFVFERHALGVRDNLTTRFLEVEITKEVYFL